jgi:hypothetical protein
MMNKNEIRHITKTSGTIQRAPHRVLTLDTHLTYKQLAEEHGMTVYEVRRALGLLQ